MPSRNIGCRVSQRDYDYLNTLAQQHASGNFSVALRFIIEQYRLMHPLPKEKEHASV